MNVKSYCPLLDPFSNYSLYQEYGENFSNFPCYALFSSATNPCVESEGSNVKGVIIGQNPGVEEDLKNKPFVGPSGQLLNSVLEELGFKRSEFYITNAVKCVGATEDLSRKIISFCSSVILRKEIQALKPDFILCLGEKAFLGLQYAIFGKEKYQFEAGNVYTFPLSSLGIVKEVKVGCVYHPSYVLRNPNFLSIYKKQFGSLLRQGSLTVTYHVIDSLEKLEELYHRLKNFSQPVVLDLETTSVNLYDSTNKILCIGLATSHEEAFVIPLHRYDKLKKQVVNFYVEGEQELVLEKVKGLLLLENLTYIGHNIKFDFKACEKLLGIDLYSKLHSDTMVLHHLIRENPPHDLKSLVDIYTPYSKYYSNVKAILTDKQCKKDWLQYLDIFEIMEYCAHDCCATYYLYNVFSKEIQKQAHWQLQNQKVYESTIRSMKAVKRSVPIIRYASMSLSKLARYQLKHYQILMEMERNGLPFSISYVNSLKKNLQEKIENLENKLHEEASKEFLQRGLHYHPINWKSTKQLKEVFLSLGYKSKVKTPKGDYSFNEEALKLLKDQGVSLASLLLDYRALIKAYTTYACLLDEFSYKVRQVSNDIVRLSCDIVITGTETGRLATREPSFHTIPRDNLYRNMVVAEDGWVIVSADYSMADLRMIAGYSGCKSMLQAFSSGYDFHRVTGSLIFNKDVSDVTTEERSIAKNVNFSIVYLVSPQGLARMINTTVEKAQEFIEKWFSDKPEVKAFIQALRNSYVGTEVGGEAVYWNVYGRMRRLIRVKEFLESKKRNPEFEHNIREIVNFYPQSTVADTLMIALLRLQKQLVEKELYPYVRLLLTIHDALLLEVKEEKVDEVLGIVKEAMEFPISFPFCELVVPVEFTVGKCWHKT